MSYFVDEDLFEEAIRIVEPAVEAFFGSPLTGERRSLYVVVDVPSSQGRVRFETLIGEPEPWKHPFRELAHGKANLCLRTGLSTSVVVNQMPWLLEEGDPIFAGGVIRDNMIAASSGQEDHFDEMFSGMILDVLAGLSISRGKKAQSDPESSGVLGEPKDVGAA